jgi:hypothetical protein
MKEVPVPRPKGTILSQETKDAISQSQKRRWAAVRELIRRADEEGTLPEPLRAPDVDKLEPEAV